MRLSEAAYIIGSLGGRPSRVKERNFYRGGGFLPTDNWILITSFWSDTGVWIDTDFWID